MNMPEMEAVVQKMTLEGLRVEFGRLADAGDRHSEWATAVRVELKKRRWLPGEPGVVRWK